MPLIEFIIGLAVLIVLHEAGHFIACRLFKIEVEEFGIGLPPRLATLFTAGGTQFTLNAIPLGGFVRPKGENDPNVPGGLASANPWARLAVLAAGPFTNLAVAAVLAIIFVYSLGEPVYGRVLIEDVSQGSPAENAGIRPGDLILKANGKEFETADELKAEIDANLGQPMTLTIQQGEEVKEITLTPRNPPPDDGAVGIAMGYQTRPTTLSRAIPSGIRLSYQYIYTLVTLPQRFFKGEATAEEVRPVGFRGMYDIYQQIRDPLWFFMAISMSLGIFNLLPVPALDGGRILFTLPEIILRKRVPPQYENMIHLVGFTMLLILLIYINLQDFINPVQLPQ